ncbi:DUF721 domain-containing protein [Streptomyces sp. BI20]|uniref:DUF721 domain-containing protein n=1 Tax=Streptomyces sp. BI20 TaxID=3403460 RepID=UPI003C774E7D
MTDVPRRTHRRPTAAPGPELPGVGAEPAAAPAEPAARRAPEPSGVDLARQALAAAKEQARARGLSGPGRAGREQRQGLRSGARADGRDPMPLMAALDRLRTERGWEMPMAVAGVMERWPELVGPQVAANCRPLRFEEHELTVRCESPTWETQMRMLAPSFVKTINEQLGAGTVRVIRVMGRDGDRPRGYGGPLRAPGTTRRDGRR